MMSRGKNEKRLPNTVHAIFKLMMFVVKLTNPLYQPQWQFAAVVGNAANVAVVADA